MLSRVGLSMLWSGSPSLTATRDPHVRVRVLPALRQAQEVIGQEVIGLGLEIVPAIVRTHNDPDRPALFAYVVGVRITFDICDCRLLGIAPARTPDRLNAAVAILVVGVFGDAGNLP